MTIDELEARVQRSEGNGLCKFNIVHKDGNEGVWACFATTNDKLAHESGKPFTVLLMNDALVGRPTWGAKITLQPASHGRSSISVQDFLKQVAIDEEASND